MLIKLETLKAYIETNLANIFVKPEKSLIEISIFFVKKLNENFWLYIDYWNFNILTIKNQYLLLLIGKFLH